MSGIAFAHSQELSWLESTKNDAGQAMALLKLLLNAPAAMEVWYEPGYVKGLHQHPMDEVFWIFSGKMMMHGKDLTPGSAIFVPGNTLYGPEYTCEEGCHFLRVELWDMEDGRPGSKPGGESELKPGGGNGRYTVYHGDMSPVGVPFTGGAKPPPPLGERSLDPVKGSFSAGPGEQPWTEHASIRPQGSQGHLLSRRALGPNPQVDENWLSGGSVLPPLQSSLDQLIYVLEGQLAIAGELLTAGGVAGIPKGTTYQLEAPKSSDVRYLRVVTVDHKTAASKDG